ncbi:MAG: hypothetical protein ACAH59_06815 [Pseudobdellovibrionaceae bacterium]
MKKVILVLLASFATSAAWAQPINLRSGTSVVINGDVVTCEGPNQELLDACSIKQNGNHYRLYVGDSVVETFYSFDQALDGAQKMKEAGLCR